MNDRILGKDELAASEASGVAEMYRACVDILARDADILAGEAEAMSMESGMLEVTGPVATMARALADKAAAMLAEMEPLLAGVMQRDANASKERTNAQCH